jgi:phenol 2-monooxygenase
MNVSMQDGFNIGWKLGHVLEGRSPERLLSTYSAERQVVAKNLIDFDKEWSTLMAKKPEEFNSPSELEDFYVSTAEFPAGFMTEYAPSMLIADAAHQDLATGFPIGKRFKSAPVVRVCDTNPMHLGHHATADGRWRIYVFADANAAAGMPANVAAGIAGTPDAGVPDAGTPGSASPLADFADWIATAPDSPLAATPEGADRDAWFDVKVIYQQEHTSVDIGTVPAAFKPQVGPFQLTDYEKVYATDPTADIFELRGLDRGGVVVVVRPDQYVANVLPLTATAELGAFFAPILSAGNRVPESLGHAG